MIQFPLVRNSKHFVCFLADYPTEFVARLIPPINALIYGAIRRRFHQKPAMENSIETAVSAAIHQPHRAVLMPNF